MKKTLILLLLFSFSLSSNLRGEDPVDATPLPVEETAPLPVEETTHPSHAKAWRKVILIGAAVAVAATAVLVIGANEGHHPHH
jgi:hypothetical protein